jgi:L-threonylcarbamoyladenylate synthase
MKTRIIKVSFDIISIRKIQEIAGVLREDGIIVYPTETFYGLGANALSSNAIKRVYRLKKRAPRKPLPVLISDQSMLPQITTGDPLHLQRLVSQFWPGPLTIILKASAAVPDELLGRKGTIGVRLTAHPWVRALVRELRFPITATSANVSGETPISDPDKAMGVFEGAVDLIVDGGKTQGLLPSTVLDLSEDAPRLVREGTIAKTQLKRHLPSLQDSPS